MASAAMHDRLAERVREAFASLPARFLGAEEGFEATYQVIVGDLGRRWEVQVSPARCVVRPSPTRRADVVIGTDARTWLAVRAGQLSSLEAVSQRRLYARGDLDLAIGFEGLFRLPRDRPPLVRLHDVRIRGARISTITAGRGDQHVLLIHGLGGSKVSFMETIAGLSRRYRVHAIDLPGFGSSSKQGRAPYDAAWFAGCVLRFCDTLAIDRAHVVGNSLGGRIALEMALTKPGRVRGLGLLCPALAFRRNRELAPLVRLLRPELAAIPHPMGEQLVRRQLSSLFASPDRLDPMQADVATGEFLRTYRDRGARVAFAAAARNIYLDAPHGPGGLWTRLAALERPGLFIWGDSDRLVPPRFAPHVARELPAADQVVLADCGHVPQVEHPDRTNRLLLDFFAQVEERDRYAEPRLLRRAA